VSRRKRVNWNMEGADGSRSPAPLAQKLVELAAKDPRIVCLTADLGKATNLDLFQKAHPERFFNVGIAEQNLVAVASGLAATGLIPVVSTYAVFASLRAAEFVRTDVAYNGRNVKIIGTLSGVGFGPAGPTHQAIEDIALMRAIPSMVVIAPRDEQEAVEAIEAVLGNTDPVYMRLGPSTTPRLDGDLDSGFEIGRAITLREGGDLTVIACGIAIAGALRAAEKAAALGVDVRVLNMHTIKPLDEEAIRRAMTETRGIVSVEDHNVVGGLGSAVADVIAASGRACTLVKLGHQDRFGPMGDSAGLIHIAGFGRSAILKAVKTLARCA